MSKQQTMWRLIWRPTMRMRTVFLSLLTCRVPRWGRIWKPSLWFIISSLQVVLAKKKCARITCLSFSPLKTTWTKQGRQGVLKHALRLKTEHSTHLLLLKPMQKFILTILTLKVIKVNLCSKETLSIWQKVTKMSLKRLLLQEKQPHWPKHLA